MAAVGLFASGALAGPAIPAFTDHDDIADAHRGSVEWAGQHGIVQGYEDGSFRPTESVSRQQIASLLHRYNARATVEREGESTRIAAGQIGTASGRCPEIMVPLSGGYEITDGPTEAAQAAQISILQSRSADLGFEEGRSNRGWEVRVANGSDRDVTVQVSLVCGPSTQR